MCIYGRHCDGRRMRLRFTTTIFGNFKVVLEGLGENLLGWSGWAHIMSFKGPMAIESALEYARYRYGFKEDMRI